MIRLPHLLFAACCLLTTGITVAAEPDDRARARQELTVLSAEVGKLAHAFNLVHAVVAPSVLSIHTREQVVNPFDRRREVREVEVGEGSGFVFHSDAKASYVVTNSHVVFQTDRDQGFVRGRNGAPIPYDRVRVVLTDNREYDAEYVGYDLETDLAVLKLAVPNLPAITWGDSDQVHIGDFVVALGYPLGVGYSATFGNISATDRSTGVYRSVGGFESFIQTDAAINPGNSGGPLVSITGDVIGINANIVSKTGVNIGLGFAIPANLVRRVAEDLLTYGRVRRPKIGVYLEELRADQAQGLGLKALQTVRVVSVIPHSPAAEGGLEKGDVILAINRMPVVSQQQFRARIASAPIGTPMAVTVWRGGRSVEQTLTPVATDELDRKLASNAIEVPKDKLVDLPLFGVHLGDDGLPGLVVVGVDPDSPLADGGKLLVGDRILRERATGPIHTLEDGRGLAIRRDLELQVYRDGESFLLRLRR